MQSYDKVWKCIYISLFKTVLRNNCLNNNLKCLIFFVPVIPSLCLSVPRGWGTLGQLTMSYNFRSSAEIVHGAKSLRYWTCTQRHWWALCRLMNTSVKYLGSKRKVNKNRPSLPRFPLLLEDPNYEKCIGGGAYTPDSIKNATMLNNCEFNLFNFQEIYPTFVPSPWKLCWKFR